MDFIYSSHIANSRKILNRVQMNWNSLQFGEFTKNSFVAKTNVLTSSEACRVGTRKSCFLSSCYEVKLRLHCGIYFFWKFIKTRDFSQKNTNGMQVKVVFCLYELLYMQTLYDFAAVFYFPYRCRDDVKIGCPAFLTRKRSIVYYLNIQHLQGFVRVQPNKI